MKSTARSQRGVSIIVTLVYLMLISFVVITAYRISGQQLSLIGNAQGRSQALAAANFALETTLSSLDFAKQPNLVAQTPVVVDVLGDGTTPFSVVRARPSCYRIRAVKSSELDLSRPSDRSCLATNSGAGASLVEGGTGTDAGNSLCTDTEWALSATVSDAVTATNLTVNQGVSVRVDQVDAASNCS